MGGMPSWFAKTAEMCAADRYFSVGGPGGAVDDADLVARYHTALGRLQSPAAYTQNSDALRAEGWDNARIGQSMGQHFVGDWIHPTNPAVGGTFWPRVPSTTVVEEIRWGTIVAIWKALGRTNLLALGMSANDVDDLYAAERETNATAKAPVIDLDGVRPLATSWNCTVPADEIFFEAEALRGPTVVELAIATPKPRTQQRDLSSRIQPLVRAYREHPGHAPTPPAPKGGGGDAS